MFFNSSVSRTVLGVMENWDFVKFLPFPSESKLCWDSQFQCLCLLLVLYLFSLFLGLTLPGEVWQRELVSTIRVLINPSHLTHGLGRAVTSDQDPSGKQWQLVEKARQDNMDRD